MKFTAPLLALLLTPLLSNTAAYLPAAVTPTEVRSQTFRDKAKDAIETGQIEAAQLVCTTTNTRRQNSYSWHDFQQV